MSVFFNFLNKHFFRQNVRKNIFFVSKYNEVLQIKKDSERKVINTGARRRLPDSAKAFIHRGFRRGAKILREAYYFLSGKSPAAGSS